MTLKWKDMSIKAKIIIPITLTALIGGVFLFFYWVNLYETNQINTLVTKARSVLLSAESARNYTSQQQKLDIFKDSIPNIDNLLYTVPIFSALKIAEAKANELGYLMKIPKISPRNPDNEPDSYELTILKKFKESKLEEFWEIDDNTNQLRYFRPVKLSQECLACHGDPATSQKLWGNNKGLDITGTKMEGWKAGQIHGAFEIKMDMLPLYSDVRNKTFVIAGIVFAIGFFIILIALFVGNKIAKSIKEMEELNNQISQGNIDVEIKINSNDEVGKLAVSFQKMIQYLKERADAIEKISLGDHNIILESKSDKDILSQSMLVVIDTLNNVVNEMSKLINATNNGDLQTRSDISIFNGDWEHLINGVNEIVESFYNVTNKVSRGVVTVANSATSISETTETMAAALEELNKQTDEVSYAVDEMSKTIDENAMSSTKTADVANENRNIAKNGVAVVESTITKMKEIATVVELSANNISKLGESSKEIGEIIGVIEEIADQTNLLALNAAIEAARAGERGRGFAVVADEVRKLAERTTDATKQISKMIKGIQKETMEAVNTMNQGTSQVKSGIELADKASDSLDQIVNSSQELLDMIAQIATASEEQSSTSKVISQNVFSISEVTTDSVARISEIATAIDETSAQARDLKELLSHFNLADDNIDDKNNYYNDTDSGLITENNSNRLTEHS